MIPLNNPISSPYIDKVVKALSLSSCYDLLTFLPSRYQDFAPDTLTKDNDNKVITVRGNVTSTMKLIRRKGRVQIFEFEVDILGTIIKCIIFNQIYLRSQLTKYREVIIRGKYSFAKKSISVTEVVYLRLDLHTGIVPIYNLPPRFANDTYWKNFQLLFEYYETNNLINDIIPSQYIFNNNLPNKNLALKYIHFPKTQNDHLRGIEYLKYEEFFLYALAMRHIKETTANYGSEILFDQNKVEQYIASLPFPLVSGQLTAINEILKDIRGYKNMLRVLQGDVGTGKTVVSAVAVYSVVSLGHQASIMAPTEILAHQLYQVYRKLFANYPYKIELLVGSLTAKQKKNIKDKLSTGDIDILVGTHALIESDVVFKDLRIAIIDEQHRFGVQQRRSLLDKNKFVNVLLMSATPIPRTMAMMLYGEFDVSTLDVIPSGKRNILSHYINTSSPETIVRIINKHATQAFIVCPLIEESIYFEDLTDVTNLYNELSLMLPSKKFTILHSKIKDDEKNRIIADFDAGNIDHLITTSVVEVGLDLKDIKLMIVLDSERFGLAQLHQLRGRIGRKGQDGDFYLLTNSSSPAVFDRLTFLIQNDDGFKVSEYDLKNRGPGQFLGIKQSGKDLFKFGTYVNDSDLLTKANKDALEFYNLNEPILKDILQYIEDKRLI